MRWSETFTVVECHAEGEVARVVTGIPSPRGDTVFDKRACLQDHAVDLRRTILQTRSPSAEREHVQHEA